jgi:hypothetical protein
MQYLVILNHISVASTNHLIGEICVVKCEAENEQIIIIIAIYISPNQSVNKSQLQNYIE